MPAMRLQDLPRSLALRCLEIPRFCRDSLGVELRNAKLVVAYSTGLDSSALLHLLHLLAPAHGLGLVAAHAHHGLRPESDRELAHALDVCAGLGIACKTARLDVPGRRKNGEGMEEAARRLRYEFLEQVRAEADADWIVTAHHADDLCEDIVMRLIRGTGWPGLGGMTGADAGRRLLRPLLDWGKDELEAFLQTVGGGWCEDATNASLRSTRNRVRHEILPLLLRENPAFPKAALQLWRQARTDADYWSETLPPAPCPSPDRVLTREALDVHKAVRLRMYKAALDAMGSGQTLASHLFLLDKSWIAGRCGLVVQFPGDKTAVIETGGIRFRMQKRD